MARCETHSEILCASRREVVLAEHNVRFGAHQNRTTTESLRRKFFSLHRRKIPTGKEDPNMPAEVKLAKHILGYKIIGEANLGDGTHGTEDMDITEDGLLSCP